MTRRLKRTPDFDVSLTLKKDDFIRPPTDAQRNSLLNRALKEFADDLVNWDEEAGKFVRGALDAGLGEDRTQADLQDLEIMEDWQLPVMQRMAEAVASSKGDVLEVGFGRGISADMLQALDIRSHTIIECNNSVIRRFNDWREQNDQAVIELVEGTWQETIGNLGQFDGIFFHTYPLNEEEYLRYVHESVTFAEHFFSVAADHLREGGSFSYFSNEINSLSRAHQRALFRYFSRVSMSIVNLEVPDDVMDTWWSPTMVVVHAVK